MRLSVVIPTRNRPADLRDLLESLQASSPPPDEIVVADDFQQADVLGKVSHDIYPKKFADIYTALDKEVIAGNASLTVITDPPGVLLDLDRLPTGIETRDPCTTRLNTSRPSTSVTQR